MVKKRGAPKKGFCGNIGDFEKEDVPHSGGREEKGVFRRKRRAEGSPIYRERR